jgi:probable HAF family extracellular repeat protein
MPAGRHAVLWERDGSAIDLGNLGGKSANNVATGINNRGEVVGNSQSSKDGNIHPFVWTRETGILGLSNLPGAIATVAPCCHTLNDGGEVVGFSIDPKGNPSAFVWRDQYRAQRSCGTLPRPEGLARQLDTRVLSSLAATIGDLFMRVKLYH